MFVPYEYIPNHGKITGIPEKDVHYFTMPEDITHTEEQSYEAFSRDDRLFLSPKASCSGHCNTKNTDTPAFLILSHYVMKLYEFFSIFLLKKH